MFTAQDIIISYMILSENRGRVGYAQLNEALKLSWYHLFKKTKESKVRKMVAIDDDGTIPFPKTMERLFGIYAIDHCGDLALLYEDTMKNIVPVPSKKCSCTCDHSDSICSFIEPAPIQYDVVINGTTYINKTFITVLKSGEIVEEKHTWIPEYGTNSAFVKATEVVSQETKCKLDVKSCGCPVNNDDNIEKLFKCGCISDSCAPSVRNNYPVLFNSFGYYKVDEDNKKIFVFNSEGKKSDLSHVLLIFECNGADIWVPEYAKAPLLALLNLNMKLYSPSYTFNDRREAKRNWKSHLSDLRRYLNPISYIIVTTANDATKKRPFYLKPHSDFVKKDSSYKGVCYIPTNTNQAGQGNITNITYNTYSSRWLKVIVDGGDSDSPVSGTNVYQNDAFKTLVSDKIEIVIDANEMQNWGQAKSFDLDKNAGTITMLNGYVFQPLSSLKVDLTQ